jgi:hypothetical protein
VLYAIPKIQQWLSGEKETGVASGTINSLIGSFQHFFDSSVHGKQQLSSSLLKKPLNLRYELIGNKIIIAKPFKLGKQTVSKAEFSVVTEGNWVRSLSFASSDKKLFCEGNMQKGADTFTIFHCARGKKR